MRLLPSETPSAESPPPILRSGREHFSPGERIRAHGQWRNGSAACRTNRAIQDGDCRGDGDGGEGASAIVDDHDRPALVHDRPRRSPTMFGNATGVVGAL